MGRKGNKTSETTSHRTNVTIALSNDTKKNIDSLKKDLKKKNITQVFNHLLDFYRKNQDKVEELEKEREDFEDRIINLEQQVRLERDAHNQFKTESKNSMKSISERVQHLEKTILENKIKANSITQKMELLTPTTTNNLMTIQSQIEDFNEKYDTIMQKIIDGEHAIEELRDIKSLLRKTKQF